MTLSKITPSILLAGAMVLTSACERTQSKTADRVADKLPTDPIATLVQKYPNIHELLQLVDNADQTAQYFTDAEKAYLKA